MNVFELRNHLVDEYSEYVDSFIQIRDPRIREYVDEQIDTGLLWPNPLIQLNPAFEAGANVDELVDQGVLHEECRRAFRTKSEEDPTGKRLRLHRHQEEAIRAAKTGASYVLTTGTGSGKSLAYIIPIVDHILRRGPGKGIQAIIVYPMNALVNSQMGELEQFLKIGYPDGKGPVTFERYTGQEDHEKRNEIMASPPDILLTNYVMLELILTRPEERRRLIRAAEGLQFLVLDELHTYRGRQGADVAMLVRRVREATNSPDVQFVGTSATLAGEGSYTEKQAHVAEVASRIFGTDVKPEHVIGETLERATPDENFSDQDFIQRLRGQVTSAESAPRTFEGYASQPLSSWIETAFGLQTEAQSGRLIRRDPRGVWGEEGAANELSDLTGTDQIKCGQAIEDWLLASYQAEPNPQTGFPVFAFRLHQFISRGDTVYATLEEENERHITVNGQQFKPGDRSKILLPLVFCRECGQEYYSVYVVRRGDGGPRSLSLRDYMERRSEASAEPGYLYISASNPWPEDYEQVLDRLPQEWLQELGEDRVEIRRNRRDHVPEILRISPDGSESADGVIVSLIGAPLRFCLNCGISYDFRQRSDFAKLSSLGSEGRSTATTILSLAAIRNIQKTGTLRKSARKLLSFTDNRQDASLQAGHFNDFVQVGVLRSALYRAAVAARDQGLQHDELAQRVFAALDLDLHHYAADPEAGYGAEEEAKAAFREVLAYRLYHDLRRGWRITSPNLEQCGLLEIEYKYLDELCSDEDAWQGTHPTLAGATSETLQNVAKVLLDHMRRELAIHVDYLDRQHQERIKQRSSQFLQPPWGIDEDENMIQAAVLFPRSRGSGDYGGNVYLSARGGFGQHLRRGPTFPHYPERMNLEETDEVIHQLIERLKKARLVRELTSRPASKEDPAYQVPAAAMVWVAGEGTQSFHDPIRVPGLPEGGGRTNPFFVDFYQSMAQELVDIEAREHTAQVPYDLREDREDRFREAELPILFCSPTMELGVDIAELNVVNMRNVPPTPANYAQRSGRAGRSGQPALVFTYCSTGSSHDQYFFKRPERMVSGAVSPPRIDLANEDLVRAHLHAIWLAETGQDLGTALINVLDLEGEEPSLALLPSVRDSLSAEAPRGRALRTAENVLDTIAGELKDSNWYSERWLDAVFEHLLLRFDQACSRWRDLYQAALRQRDVQHRIVGDAARTERDRNQARMLRDEAENQLQLLTETRSVVQSDFYSYRYFASEGFLPGYNFPRLPISAFIPARRVRGASNEYLNRPRFLAISEFGPRSFVYHEGSRYIINRVILPVDREDGDLPTRMAKQCGSCGYLHPIGEGEGPDLCNFCEATLGPPMRNLFRMQNVSTKRRDRINCDEEERLRMGFEIRSAVRFGDGNGTGGRQFAELKNGSMTLGRMTYGHAATIWRINVGWRRRANPNQLGFRLDMERGYWARNEEADEEDPGDPMTPRVERVVPYVEDHKNSLIFEPAGNLDEGHMASLQAALKDAIQVRYQLEDNELAAEPLPDRDERKSILFYEASEGGAGVLRQLLEDPDEFASVAKVALEICHFDPETGEDLRRAPRAREDCEAACYDCLMSYMNQLDHPLLDRQLILPLLMEYREATVHAAPAPRSRVEHLQRLKNLTGSDLELRWLDLLEEKNLRLPTHAQKRFNECHTKPDFYFENEFVVVYVDGPHHDYPEREARDRDQRTCMEDLGFTVIRFGYEEDWMETIQRYPSIFGKGD